MRLCLLRHASTRRHFGEAGHQPALNPRLGVPRPVERRAQLLIALEQLPGRAVYTCQARCRHQFLGQVLEDAAIFPRAFVFSLHLQHCRPCEPRLCVARIGAQHLRQICQGGVELMHSLPQCGAHDQHFRGRIIEMPPRGQCSFTVARVTRITCDAAQLQVARRHAGRQDQVIRRLQQLSLQRPQLVQGGIAR